MTETGNAVKSLIFESGKTSPEMTHDLKVLGKGNMQNGIKQLASFFLDEGRQSGYHLGERNGVIKGVAGTLFIGSLIAGGYYIVDRYRISKIIKKHEKEGKKILHVMNADELENAVDETNPELQEE